MWIGFRELCGWLLTIVGLALIGVVLALALNRQILEAMTLSLPSVIVFRDGIGFVRMAAAGRIAAGLARAEADS